MNLSTTPSAQAQYQQPDQTMPPIKLTLILAATPSLGIGKNGTLPWPQLRKEMGYFARITKYVPRSILAHTAGGDAGKQPKIMNAVVMGRKTWDSIPSKFRPLQGRLNVVVSGSLPPSTSLPAGGSARPTPPPATRQDEQAQGAREKEEEGPIILPSLSDALSFLESLALPSSSPPHMDARIHIHRAFIIGGAQLYASALALPQTDRILLTRVRADYDCDTFFPDVFRGGDGGEWREASEDEWRAWTGEVDDGEKKVVARVEEEKGVGFEFGMWVR